MLNEILRPIYLHLRTLILTVITPFLNNKKLPIHRDEIKNILIIRLDGIGDMVLSIPTITSIRILFPNAKITLLCNETPSKLFANNSILDDIIVYTKRISLSEPKYDLVFDLYDDYHLKFALIAYMTKAKYRIGFNTSGRGVFFTHSINKKLNNTHYADTVIQLLTVFETKNNLTKPTLEITEEERVRLQAQLITKDINITKPIFTVHPGGATSAQRWPATKFAELCTLISKNSNVQIIFVGSAIEENLIKDIQSKISIKTTSFINEPFRLTLALIQKSELLICNNSGLLHVASAFKTPTVSTMGPTIATRWWPIGNNNIVIQKSMACIGCNRNYCKIKTHDCMEQITVNEMFDAIAIQQKKTKPENLKP
jgi:lipopolysaccharide heptosyltransferase II